VRKLLQEKRRFLSLFTTALVLLWMAGPAEPLVRAQSSGTPKTRRLLLHATVKPGEVLRYELEAAGAFLPIADASGAILSPARGPCDYALAAIVTLRPQAPDKDGNIPVQAQYSQTRVSSARCALFSAPDFEKRLVALESSPVVFRVGPHGETALNRAKDGYFKYWDGGDLLRKATEDLLQTEFAPHPVSAGESWKPRGQFAYARDRALKDLELSGSDLRFRNLVQVDGRSCAWVTSQYIFSPIDLPAAGTASGGRTVPAAGNNAVAAVLHISLLLDPVTQHVAWLHRSETIDNKLTLASPYDDSDPTEDAAGPDDPPDGENPMPDLSSMRSDNPGRYPFMTFHFQEEARARLLPDEHSTEWLSALKRFESTPEPESGSIPFPITRSLLPNQITLASKPATVNRSTHKILDSDSLLTTPAGFTRYEKGLCRDVWFCASVSVALPGEVEVSEDTPLRTVFLAGTRESRLSIAVGPALDRRPSGLREDEELKKQAQYYLENFIWLAAKPGIGANFSDATLDGYPSLVVDFSATQRNIADIHGVLGIMLTPWGKVVPVSCSAEHSWTAQLQSECEKVITSVSLRR